MLTLGGASDLFDVMKKIILTLLIAGGGIFSAAAATYEWNGATWVESSSEPAEKSVYTIDQAYGKGNAAMITSINAGEWIDFGSLGSVATDGQNELNLKQKFYKFTATLDMNISQEESLVPVGEFVLETRWLLTGYDLWNREGENGPNYLESFCLGLNGDAMNKLETGIADSFGGLTEFVQGAGNYRFIATKDEGIGVQYSRQVTAAVPEPATTALGLLGLIGLMARRRRTC